MTCVTIGYGKELDRMSESDKFRGGAAKLQLAIVGTCSDAENPKAVI